MRVHRLDSIGALDAFGTRWDEMVLASGDAGIFCQRGWLERVLPWYRSQLGQTPAFLVAERQGELLALAPLARMTKDWAHARQQVLGFLGGTWDEIDHWLPGFLFATRDAGMQSDAMQAIAAAIADDDWDLLELRLLREGCASHGALAARFPGLRVAPVPLKTPRLVLEAGFDAWWATRSKRLRRMLERGRQRAAQEGLALAHEVTGDVPAERRGEFERIHRERQDRVRAAGRARSSPFEDAGARETFWSLVDWARARGQLRVHWLTLDGRTAAYSVVLHHDGTSFAWFNAIDPAAERVHPGSLLLAGLVEREAKAHGATTIDLMVGGNLTKTLFATEEIAHSHLTVVNSRRPLARAKSAWISGLRRLRRGGRR